MGIYKIVSFVFFFVLCNCKFFRGSCWTIVGWSVCYKLRVGLGRDFVVSILFVGLVVCGLGFREFCWIGGGKGG